MSLSEGWNRGEVTKITKATSTSRSLRATVPMGIVKQFKLKEGNSLDGEIRPEGERLVVVVKPLKTPPSTL